MCVPYLFFKQEPSPHALWETSMMSLFFFFSFPPSLTCGTRNDLINWNVWNTPSFIFDRVGPAMNERLNLMLLKRQRNQHLHNKISMQMYSSVCWFFWQLNPRDWFCPSIFQHVFFFLYLTCSGLNVDCYTPWKWKKRDKPKRVVWRASRHFFLFSFVLCFISAHVFIQIIMGWKKKKNGGLAGLKKLVMFLLSCSSGTVFSAYIAKSHSPLFFFLL